MAEYEVERRLRAAARELDARAPAFDAGLLGNSRPRRVPRRAVILACFFALAAVSPAALSALSDLFDVDEVPALKPLEYGVAPSLAGRTVPVSAVQASTPWRVHEIASLGTPSEARVRDDITGGMVTLVYRNILLIQWRTTDVSARIALVPAAGKAEEVDAGGQRAMWVEGEARGTLRLIGADGAVHRESFEVRPGALLWRKGGMSFLLQGAPSKDDAARLANDVGGQ